LEFGGQGFNANGILTKDANGIEKIVFNAAERYKLGLIELPSFIIPPNDVKNLNLFHGSCRKPHGEGVDGLLVLHDAIRASHSSIEFKRPHILCLTGDQIYADDVAGVMLKQILSYHEPELGTLPEVSLIGWKENLPEVVKDGETSTSKMVIGSRHEIIKEMLDVPEHNANTSKNHLLRMTEYILMYCMTWSRELWTVYDPSTDDLPNFSETYGWSGKSDFTYSDPGGIGSIGQTRVEKDAPTHDYKVFIKELYQVRLFRGSLDRVRKALANIATYMVMDDHDVTDDWFFNEKWCSNVLDNTDSSKKALGIRWIQNGMAAIALCQSWGNNPDQFDAANSAGRKIVNAINTICTTKSPSSSGWGVIEDLVLPIIADEIPATSTHDKVPKRLVHFTDPAMVHGIDTFNWHWYFSYGNYEFIGLDSRTMRSFVNGENGPAGLLSNEALDLQVKNITSIDKELTILIAGAPILGIPSVEDSLNSKVAKLKDKVDLDKESWNLAPGTKQALFSKLLKRVLDSGPKKHRVLTLSGDVHYAFSCKMSYHANETYLHRESDADLLMAQCCCSALKNMTREFPDFTTTYGQHIRSIDGMWFGFGGINGNNITEYGWNDDSPSFSEALETYRLQYLPASPGFPELPILPSMIGYPTEDYIYYLDFAVQKPEISIGVTVSSTGLDRSIKRAEAHKNLAGLKNITGGSWIVGYPCIGNITFEDWTLTTKKLSHNLLWINDEGLIEFNWVSMEDDVDFVSTKHIIDLT
jgi:hypothetical protein